MKGSRSVMEIVPERARLFVILYALSFALFSVHPLILGLRSHIFVFNLLFPEYAHEQLPLIAAYPINEVLHRLGGAVLVGLGLMQFSPELRRARPKLHRWGGRVYVALALLAAGTGLFMGFVHPFGGFAETIPSVVFGALLAVSTGAALVTARRRKFELHREWVARSFAIATGPWSIRLSSPLFTHVFGMDERDAIVWAFWAGWGINLAITEYWIHARKRRLAALKAKRRKG